MHDSNLNSFLLNDIKMKVQRLDLVLTRSIHHDEAVFLGDDYENASIKKKENFRTRRKKKQKRKNTKREKDDS